MSRYCGKVTGEERQTPTHAARPFVLAFVLLLLLPAIVQAVQSRALDRPMSADDTRHLLSRTGIGVAPADFIQYRSLTRQQAVDKLLSEFTQTPVVAPPGWVNLPVPHYHARPDMDDNERAVFNNDRDAELAQLRSWWMMEMLQTPSPQTERMVLFWHDVFATSYYGTDRQSLAMARQNQTFRELAMGSWSRLLKAMIRDPALLEYLNAGSNHKDSPNENLARELLELFTLGEGNFDEAVVKQAARTLTGHNTRRLHNLAFQFQSWKHDHGIKTLFGESGNFRGDDLIDSVLAKPAASRFLATRFWQAFVADTPVDEQWLVSIAGSFRTSDYSIASLYRSVLESDAFWREENRGALIKSPVDLIAGTARSLEYPKQRWLQLSGWQSHLGMALFAPPDVSGWQEGGAFITPGRLLDRFDLLDRLVAPVSGKPVPASHTMAKDMAAEMIGNDTGVDMTERFALRLAAEDYRGPVRYDVTVFDSRKPTEESLIWRSDALVVKHGRDTERDGRIGNLGELNWATLPLTIPGRVIDDATHVDVTFLNDAAGPGGDRNLYVDGIVVDGQWFGGAQAVQVSECSPNLSANAWKLYCAGSIRFSIASQRQNQRDSDGLPAWRAAAVHIGWASDNPETDRQTLYLTLDHVNTPSRNFHTLQFSVITEAGRPAKLRLESFGCWPACVEPWPACAWHDKHYQQSRTLSFARIKSSDAFWQSEQGGACHYNALDVQQRELVNALWHSVESLLSDVQTTNRAQRQFAPVLEKVSRRLLQDPVALRDTPYAGEHTAIVVDQQYASEPPMRTSLPALTPLLHTEEQLQAVLRSARLPVQHLLMPMIDEWIEADLTLQQWIEKPEFQLK